MLTPDLFDIAPSAQRPPRGVWLLLGMALVFAAFSAFLLDQGLTALQQARRATAAKEEAERAQQRRAAAAQQQINDPVVVERARAQKQLQRSLRLSWSNLFDALERAGHSLDGRVSITALSDAGTQDGAAAVRLSGLALTNETLLQYVEALQEQRSVRNVILGSQEPAQGGAVPATRFHLLLLWDPAEVSAQKAAGQ